MAHFYTNRCRTPIVHAPSLAKTVASAAVALCIVIASLVITINYFLLMLDSFKDCCCFELSIGLCDHRIRFALFCSGHSAVNRGCILSCSKHRLPNKCPVMPLILINTVQFYVVCASQVIRSSDLYG
jgi:hypothetical protein